MPSSQQEKPQENKIPTVFLKAFELIDEKKIDKLEDVETPLLLVEEIENFKESVFWMKIRNLWVLIGKVPPLSLKENDIVFFKEKGRWGLFKYISQQGDYVILQDAKGERKTKVPKDVLDNLELFGKALRIQERV